MPIRDLQSQLEEIGLSQETLDKAKKRLQALTVEWEDALGVCYGSTWDLKGGEIKGHTACHAWVSDRFRQITGRRFGWNTNYNNGAKPFLTLTCHTPKKSTASAEATEAIILWMAQSTDSPFSQFILNRDDTESVKRDGAIILCGPGGASHAVSMWMCKVLRYATEGSKALDVWHTLYKGGVNPILAVMVCSYISAVKGATFTAAQVSGHAAVFGKTYYDNGRDDAALSGVMSFTFNPAAADTLSVFHDPKGKKLTTKSVDTIIAGFTKPFAKDDGWGGKITGNGVTGEELVQRVLGWQNELGGWKPSVPGQEPPAPVEDQVFERPKRVRKPKVPAKTDVYIDFDL